MKANAGFYFLFVFITIFISIQASHFQGGTITYKILNVSGSTVSILLTQTYSYTRTVVFCNDSMIAKKSPLIYSGTNQLGYLGCINYCNQSGGFRNISISLYCTDYSTNLNITVGQRSDLINLTIESYFLVAFTGSAWRPLSLSPSLSWSVSCLINLRIRSSGRFNNPPAATIISPIYIPQGIQRAILIPTIDADNDQVRCRFANGSNECASVCYPTSLPNETVVLPNCTLLIKGANVADWYAVTIMIEDFVDHMSATPLSSVPLQFLISVQANDSCSSPPLLTGPTDQLGQCHGIQVNKSFIIELVAENFCPNLTTINDIAILSFPNVIKTPIVRNTTTLWSVSLTWTPTVEQVGSQILCAMAIDSANVQSNQYCMTFTVAEGSVPLCPGQIVPTTIQPTTAGPTSTLQNADSSVAFTSTDHSTTTVRTSVHNDQTWADTTISSNADFFFKSSLTTILSTHFLQESSTSDQEINVTSSIAIPSPPACNFPWPWPWLAPLLSALATLLLVCIVCCCYPLCCPCCPRERRKKKDFPQTHQGDLIRPPDRPYTVYNAFEDDQDPDRNRRSPSPKKTPTPHCIKPPRRPSKVAPTSTSSTAINISPRPPTPTVQEAYIFGRRGASKLRVASNNNHQLL